MRSVKEELEFQQFVETFDPKGLQNFLESKTGFVPEGMFDFENDSQKRDLCEFLFQCKKNYEANPDKYSDAEIEEFENEFAAEKKMFLDTKDILNNHLVEQDYRHNSATIAQMINSVVEAGINYIQYKELVSVVEKRIKQLGNAKNSLKAFRKGLKSA